MIRKCHRVLTIIKYRSILSVMRDIPFVIEKMICYVFLYDSDCSAREYTAPAVTPCSIFTA